MNDRYRILNWESMSEGSVVPYGPLHRYETRIYDAATLARGLGCSPYSVSALFRRCIFDDPMAYHDVSTIACLLVECNATSDDISWKLYRSEEHRNAYHLRVSTGKR